jgi:hypothetical protein
VPFSGNHRRIRFDLGKAVNIRSQLPKDQFVRRAETDTVSTAHQRAKQGDDYD